MKSLALALLFLLGTAALADDLVTTARAAKEKKKKSTTKVITNADLKKSKSTVAENKAAAPLAAPEKSLAEQYETAYRDRLIHDEKLAAAQRNVAALERELAAVEQSYYAENDLDKRDRDIVKKFNETSEKLEQARKDLAALSPNPSP
jgi:hypothetical protein